MGMQTSPLRLLLSRVHGTLVAQSKGEDADLGDRVFSILGFTRLGGGIL